MEDVCEMSGLAGVVSSVALAAGLLLLIESISVLNAADSGRFIVVCGSVDSLVASLYRQRKAVESIGRGLVRMLCPRRAIRSITAVCSL